MTIDSPTYRPTYPPHSTHLATYLPTYLQEQRRAKFEAEDEELLAALGKEVLGRRRQRGEAQAQLRVDQVGR